MSHIAFLGIGAMGSRMAASLLDAGHELAVWNRTPGPGEPLVARGARLAESPRDAARDAAFVIAMLRDDDVCRDVWLNPTTGALGGMGRGAIAIESSTVTVGWARALAEAAAAAGVAALDAPVSGSRPQAEAKQLVFLVGGEAEAVARAEPVLKAMGSAVHHAGPAGAGAIVKLAVNALLAAQIAGLAELIGVLDAAGLDPARMVEIAATTPVFGPAAKLYGGHMAARQYGPLAFPVELVEKDLGYTEALAGGAEAPILHATHAAFRRALQQGLGAENITAIGKLYRPQP